MITPDLTAAVEADPTFAGHRTARRAVEVLIEQDDRYRCPTRAERMALLVGFAKLGKTLNGAAFNAVRLTRPVDLLDAESIAANVDAITICEIKSTKQPKIGTDFGGYFFNVTAAELLTAQSLGERYRFVFISTVTGEHQEMALTRCLGGHVACTRPGTFGSSRNSRGPHHCRTRHRRSRSRYHRRS